MNRRAFLFLLFLAVTPAHAHHTKDHVLGAPGASVITPPAQATSSSSGFWLALGPFFVIALVGVVRWRYRHRHDRQANHSRGAP